MQKVNEIDVRTPPVVFIPFTKRKIMKKILLLITLMGCNEVTTDDCINFLVECSCDEAATECQESCSQTYSSCMDLVHEGV